MLAVRMFGESHGNCSNTQTHTRASRQGEGKRKRNEQKTARDAGGRARSRVLGGGEVREGWERVGAGNRLHALGRGARRAERGERSVYGDRGE